MQQQQLLPKVRRKAPPDTKKYHQTGQIRGIEPLYAAWQNESHTMGTTAQKQYALAKNLQQTGLKEDKACVCVSCGVLS